MILIFVLCAKVHYVQSWPYPLVALGSGEKNTEG